MSFHCLEKIKQLLKGELFVNVVWVLGSEMAGRLSRILTIFALAAAFGLREYGTAILALATHEILRMLLKSGTGAQVIQCQTIDLPKIAQNAPFIQWGLGALLMIIQVSVGWFIGSFYQDDTAGQAIMLMSGVYLLYPFVSVKANLLQREGRLKSFSMISGLCIFLENLGLATFALLGAGVFSVVISKYVFALAWVILFSCLTVKGYGVSLHLPTLRKLLDSSFKLAGTELFKSARSHADIFIAGKLLLPELFGLYSFAKSAGIGLSQSVSTAFNVALFPYLCRMHRERDYQSRLVWIYAATLCIGLCFFVQALLVPYYVPFFFGEKWLGANETVALLCYAIVPVVVIDTYCTQMRAEGLYTREMHIRILSLVMVCALPLVLAPNNSRDYASVVCAGNVACLMILLVFSLRSAFKCHMWRMDAALRFSKSKPKVW